MADPYVDGVYRWWHLSVPSPELIEAEAGGWLEDAGAVLDIGCGLGTEISYLAGKGWKAAGVDRSGVAVGSAKHAHGGVSFVQADVLALPFPAGIFDLALDRGCFHYLSPPQWPGYAAEARRVLRPGGRLLLRACYTATASGYSATGYFGYGETQLGEVHLYFEVELKGAESRSKPVRFESSAAVVNLIFEGNRLLYTSKYPAGIPVGGAGNSHHAGNVPAGEMVQWAPNGYKAFYKKASVQSVWHEWNWNMADYPGTWYFWAKNVKFVDVGRAPTTSAMMTTSAKTRRELGTAMGEQLLGSPRPGHGRVFVLRNRHGEWSAS